jgi:Arc/MetJ-type ribon-helix-helix transcriptional regulator
MSKPDTPSQTDEQPRTVQLPAQTADAISERLAGTDFDSVEEYVAFALDQLLYELDREDGDSPRQDEREPDDPPVDDDVSERLDSLGYL